MCTVYLYLDASDSPVLSVLYLEGGCFSYVQMVGAVRLYVTESKHKSRWIMIKKEHIRKILKR